MGSEQVLPKVPWEHFRHIGSDAYARGWLSLQMNRGLAHNTLCAYSRGLEQTTGNHLVYTVLARKVFGKDHIDGLLKRINERLDGWGYAQGEIRSCMCRTLCEALLAYRTPRIEDLTYDRLVELQKKEVPDGYRRMVALSRVLHGAGIIEAPLLVMKQSSKKIVRPSLTDGIASEWARLARHWYETSTAGMSHRLRVYYVVLSVGRWLAANHSEVWSPADWNRDLAAQCVAMLANFRCGD